MIDKIKHSMRELKDTVLEIFQQVRQRDKEMDNRSQEKWKNNSVTKI